MTYIALGSLGFLIIHFFDFISLKRIPLAKPATWLLGSILLGYSMAMAALTGDKLELPTWSIWLGWLLLAVSLSLLIYSLFIALPFRKTYIASGVGDKLITTGLYAIVRHPGVYWLALLMVSLSLVSSSSLMLIAASIWILLDIFLVVMQDLFFLGKMFPEYSRYRRITPMLLPNRKSTLAFISSLREAKTE